MKFCCTPYYQKSVMNFEAILFYYVPSVHSVHLVGLTSISAYQPYTNSVVFSISPYKSPLILYASLFPAPDQQWFILWALKSILLCHCCAACPDGFPVLVNVGV